MNVKLDHSPKDPGQKPTYLKPPPSIGIARIPTFKLILFMVHLAEYTPTIHIHMWMDSKIQNHPKFLWQPTTPTSLSQHPWGLKSFRQLGKLLDFFSRREGVAFPKRGATHVSARWAPIPVINGVISYNYLYYSRVITYSYPFIGPST